MKTFTIDPENSITVYDSAEQAAAASETPSDSFASEPELAALVAGWPAARLVATWNSLPGVTPVARFENRTTAVRRIWKRLQSLGEPATVSDKTQPLTTRKATAGARSRQGTLGKGKASHKTTRARSARTAKTGAGPSKKERVLALLRRKHGVTLADIIEQTGWQPHTVRGFMAGAMKKAGYRVESFKPEDGQRTYRIR